MDIDKPFKMTILIFAVIFLVLYYQNSQNGRYTTIKEIPGTAFDTRTGIIYFGGKELLDLRHETLKKAIKGTDRQQSLETPIPEMYEKVISEGSPEQIEKLIQTFTEYTKDEISRQQQAKIDTLIQKLEELKKLKEQRH